MESLTILKIGLIVHITGITMMVGGMVANFVAFQQLWKFLQQEREKALLIVKAVSRFPRLQVIGGGLILAGGITMMVAFQGAFMHQTWFKIKMGLLVVIILNAVFIARPAGRKLRVILSGNAGGDAAGGAVAQEKVLEVKRGMTLFYLLQFLLFLGIFTLSVFQ